jgi:hypothetical protein
VDVSYRIAQVNSELTRVFRGDELIGQVRMGMDKRWYPELPGTIGMPAAVQSLIIANEAIEQYLEAVGGQC